MMKLVTTKPTSAANLLKALNNNLVSVSTVKIESKDYESVKTITADQFKRDLDFYMQSGIFADSIDFKYEVVGKNLVVHIGNMSDYCDSCISVDLTVNDGVSKDLEKVLRKVED